MSIEIIMPLSVHHFVRDDGQKITLTIYWCRMLPSELKLSEEHQEYRWMDLEKDKELLPKFFDTPVNNFRQYIAPKL